MRYIANIIDFVLYSNIWIAGSAAALYFYSKYYFTSDVSFDYVGLFVFCTSVWLYSLHRFIGLHRTDESNSSYRYSRIRAHKRSFQVIAAVCFLASLLLLKHLSSSQFLVLSILGTLSLLYVLPVFSRQRRLRDFHYIKLFVIAFVWGGLTVILPYDQCKDCHSYLIIFSLFIERSMFVFALTLPFDIRDLEVDRADGVKTLAMPLGIKGVWLTSLSLLIFSSILFVYFYLSEQIGTPILYIHLGTNFITLLCVLLAIRNKHDWYFTGALDGAMYLPYLLLLFCL